MKKQIRVLVVGGGFGGVKTAMELANNKHFQVQLVSDNTHFEYHGALYRSAVGHSPLEVVIPLREIFENAANVEVVLDKIAFLDHSKKRAAGLDGAVYSYDVSILAMGNVVNFFGIEGLNEHACSMNTINEAITLRRKLTEAVTAKKTTPLRVTIVGGGPSGIELAGEIKNFAQIVAKKHQLSSPRVAVSLVEGADRLLPTLSPKISQKVIKRLHQLGVELYLNTKVNQCQSGELCTNAGQLKADVIVWTAGSKPVDFFKKHPDLFTLGRGGKVEVDELLQAVNQPDLFVIGDNAATKYSGMAQTALYDAKFVANNLKRAVTGKSIKAYKPRKPLYIIPVGPNWAVAEKNRRIISGLRGWRIRRQGDLTILRNFKPYKQAVKLWRYGEKMAKF